MLDFCFQIAFIGPGGPELLVVMLVLLLMFGAKDAPKIFRKINEVINSLRNTADGFKREIMYGDLNSDVSSSASDYDSASDDYSEYHDDDYDPEDDDGERDYSNETFQGLEKELEEDGATLTDEQTESTAAPSANPAESDDETGDVRKA